MSWHAHKSLSNGICRAEILSILVLSFAFGGVNPAIAADIRADGQYVLNEDRAKSLIGPFYKALTAKSEKEVEEHLTSVTSSGWISCATNDSCEDRKSVISRWSRRVHAVPDMKWEFKEIIVTGNKIIVRGEGTGTPSGDFLGVPYSGRSFRILAIDVHTVEQGLLSSIFHVEDWAGAARQLRGQ